MAKSKKPTKPRKKTRYSKAEIIDAIEQAGGIVAAAARILGCSRMTIVRRLDTCEDITRSLGAAERDGRRRDGGAPTERSAETRTTQTSLRRYASTCVPYKEAEATETKSRPLQTRP